MRDSDTKAYRVVGTFTDMNERKLHELQLSQQLDELRFALASEKVLMDELDRKNKELVELSITDGLTGLYNHRHLQERFDYEFKRVRRYGGMLSCLLIDIDHFKSLNDTYGHQYGDYVIRQIASIIKTRSREVDICGRYGGEEFMVISNLNEKNALLYATKLHSAVRKYSFEHPSVKVKVTVSIGIAEYNNEIRTKQELIERADRAMYQAKNDGRNLIRLWKESESVDIVPIDRDEIAELKDKFMSLSAQMHSNWINSTSALVNAGETKDPRAIGHSSNVANYAVAIAKKMKLTKEQIDIIRFGALLHDIGKICIPDHILCKRHSLTEKEKLILQRHPEVGANIIKEIKSLEKELPIILYHHERFDGNGFPHGLHGREIPLGARIVAVANAFDVMICGRASGRKITVAAAHSKLIKGKKTIYCPDTVDAFSFFINKQMGDKSISRKKP
jgi:diguanylate cyclase (GGDEF)-like protein/putative nucleotidyltransferase with HDIG domain